MENNGVSDLISELKNHAHFLNNKEVLGKARAAAFKKLGLSNGNSAYWHLKSHAFLEDNFIF